jgi:hypothetical protein
MQRRRQRREQAETRRAALKDAREHGRPPPRKPRRRRGGMRISTPRVGVTLSMSRGRVRFGCPVCRTVLYDGVGTPHEGSMRGIERHVRLCQGRKELIELLGVVGGLVTKELIGVLELAGVVKAEDEELRELMREDRARRDEKPNDDERAGDE